MFDRRLEVKNGLEHLATLDLRCADSRYDIVKRFTHSFEILNRQIGRQVQFWNRLPIDRLFKKLSPMEHARSKPIPWLAQKTFQNRFWIHIRALAQESLLDIDDFAIPHILRQDIVECRLEWYGDGSPLREFYSEGVVERFESPGDLVDYTPTGHFANWWELRLDLLEVLEWYGLVLPEDVDLDDRWSFYLTEDQLDTQKAVYVTVNNLSLLCDGVISHARSLLVGARSDWAIAFSIGDEESIYLYRDICYAVGKRIRECGSLLDVANEMRK
jgi:hypothetical protein